MGDITAPAASHVPVTVTAHAGSGIEKIELRNGPDVLETIRTYDQSDLGHRVRIIWSGAEYRGRGRNTGWRGVIDVEGASILSTRPLNQWNPERLLEQRGSAQVAFESVTTGNFAGVDLWLDSLDSTVSVRTNLGELAVSAADLGPDPVHLECGGLERRLTVMRLPDTELSPTLSFTRDVMMNAGADNPVWVCVTTEDGHQAWSSPIYFTA